MKKIASFIGLTTVFFLLGFIVLLALGLVPDSLRSRSATLRFLDISVRTRPEPSVVGELPQRIVIPSIGVDTPIENPQSTDIAVLDAELQKGAVRYPGAGLLGDGHLFIFAHSSNLPTVRNEAYKAFTGLGRVEVGDTIQLYSDNAKYIYEVFSVRLTTADEAYVDFSVTETMLTLSTCNTFGKKQDRFVVEARFVSTNPL